MLSRAHQLKHGKPSLSMGARPEKHVGEHGAADGPGAAGLWEGQSWGPAGKERVFSGVVGRGRKGRGRTEKSRLRGRFRRSRSVLCCVVSVQQGQIQISLLNAVPLLLASNSPCSIR